MVIQILLDGLMAMTLIVPGSAMGGALRSDAGVVLSPPFGGVNSIMEPSLARNFHVSRRVTAFWSIAIWCFPKKNGGGYPLNHHPAIERWDFPLAKTIQRFGGYPQSAKKNMAVMAFSEHPIAL